MTHRFRPTVGLASLALALACGDATQPTGAEPDEAAAARPGAAEPAPAEPAAARPGAAEPAADLRAEAKELFDQRCTACHGALGKGDGPKAAILDTTPRNYQDAAWQDSISDEQIAKVILYGGEATGVSAEMPGNPDLVGQDELVAALVAYVRTFRR